MPGDQAAMSVVWRKVRAGEPLTPDERRMRSEYMKRRMRNSTRVYWQGEEEYEWVAGKIKESGAKRESTFIRETILAVLENGVPDAQKQKEMKATIRDLERDLKKWKEMFDEVSKEKARYAELNRAYFNELKEFARRAIAKSGDGE